MRRLVVLLVALAGCTLFEDDPPDRTCESNADCFVAQGESCNEETHECEVMPDAGTP